MDYRGQAVAKLSHRVVGEVGLELAGQAVELEGELVRVHGGGAVEDFRRDGARMVGVALGGEDCGESQLGEGA